MCAFHRRLTYPLSCMLCTSYSFIRQHSTAVKRTLCLLYDRHANVFPCLEIDWRPFHALETWSIQFTLCTSVACNWQPGVHSVEMFMFGVKILNSLASSEMKLLRFEIRCLHQKLRKKENSCKRNFLSFGSFYCRTCRKAAEIFDWRVLLCN